MQPISPGTFGQYQSMPISPNAQLPGAGGGGFFGPNIPGIGSQGVQGAGGMDKVTMALLLMNALGTGFQAYSQAQQSKKDREFQQRKYDEGAEVRQEGRNRLMKPIEQHQIQNHDFFNNGQPLQGGVAAPPPVGPNAGRDEELQRILRARLGGQY